MTPERKQEIIKGAKALMEIIRVIVDAIEECGTAPTGSLYASLLGRDVIQNLEQFNRLMEYVTATGRVTKAGYCYRKTTPKERAAYDQKVRADLDSLTAGRN